MRKVILSVIALAMGLALVLAVIVPTMSHTRETGRSAYQRGQSIGPAVEQILK